MRDRIAALVAALRSAGAPVSVAELLDAHEAVAVAGFSRPALREALAATLVKDHAWRGAFEEAFAAAFPPAPRHAGSAPESSGGGIPQARGGGGAGDGPPPEEDEQEDAERKPALQAGIGEGEGDESARPGRESEHAGASDDERSDVESEEAGASHEERRDAENARDGEAGVDGEEAAAASAARLARGRALSHRAFRDVTSGEMDELRSLAEELARRLRRRWSRRLRRARRGRIDLRRTMRRAATRGGVPLEILKRRRRPGKPDLVALLDLSWSARLASGMMLALLRPCLDVFGRVELLGYVDDPVSISLEQGHVVPHRPVDWDAPSDFGRVLQRLVAEPALGTRRSLLLILGDGRNNRRPAQAAALRTLHDRVAFVAWLVPEPRVRWGTGDSDLPAYARHVDLLLETPHLAALAASLGELPPRLSVRRRPSPGVRGRAALA